MILGPCWRCEMPGHVAAECDRPPATTRAELEARRTRYVDRWIARQITPEQKRAWIQAENRMFDPKRKAVPK